MRYKVDAPSTSSISTTQKAPIKLEEKKIVYTVYGSYIDDLPAQKSDIKELKDELEKFHKQFVPNIHEDSSGIILKKVRKTFYKPDRITCLRILTIPPCFVVFTVLIVLCILQKDIFYSLFFLALSLPSLGTGAASIMILLEGEKYGKYTE